MRKVVKVGVTKEKCGSIVFLDDGSVIPFVYYTHLDPTFRAEVESGVMDEGYVTSSPEEASEDMDASDWRIVYTAEQGIWS